VTSDRAVLTSRHSQLDFFFDISSPLYRGKSLLAMTLLGVDSFVARPPSPQLSDEELVDSVLGQAKQRPAITPETSGLVSYERKLGDSELSYYLPGRAAGVNDMCALLHLF